MPASVVLVIDVRVCAVMGVDAARRKAIAEDDERLEVAGLRVFRGVLSSSGGIQTRTPTTLALPPYVITFRINLIFNCVVGAMVKD